MEKGHVVEMLLEGRSFRALWRFLIDNRSYHSCFTTTTTTQNTALSSFAPVDKSKDGMVRISHFCMPTYLSDDFVMPVPSHLVRE